MVYVDIFSCRPAHVMSTIEVIVNEARAIPAELPNVKKLKEALRKAQDWLSTVENMHKGEHYPYLDVLEELVNRGKPLPMRLEPLPQVSYLWSILTYPRYL